ncbi:MAG: FimV/HubP family polar landmark protein [Betaproteobacteria bacterium]
MDTLAARLADQATYASNKIDYGGALTRIRVALEQRAGRPVLKVSSTQPINEPFLDLLIELNWATGRLLREYTFLLDPPGFAATTAVEPAAAIPAQTIAPAASPRAAPPAPGGVTPVAGSASTYGPVKRGETLGRIASQLKPEGATLEQMLAALYRSNAQAFDGNNMNRLRAGQVLAVPNAGEITSLPHSEAMKEIRVQAADWRSYRDRLAGAVTAPSTAEGGRQTAGGRITTAVEDQGGTGRSAADRLRLSKGEGAAGAGGATARAENNAASQKALGEANSRVSDLENLVRDLQRQLELKNSSLQAQQLAAEQAKAAAAAVAAKTAAAPPPVAPPVVAAPAPVPVSPAPVPTPAVAPAPVIPATPPPAPVVASTEPAKAEPVKQEVVAEPPKAKPPLRPPVPQQEPSFLDELMANTTLLLGVAVILVGGFFAWLMARRRRQVATKFEDSIGASTDIRTSTVFGNTGGGVVNTGDNSLVSDFSREGLGNIDTGEVDPIAEAEVYLAYGRDNQAEEILRDALSKTPDRQEIRLKLLEIYAQQNKPSAFETVASEVFAATNGSGEVWAKATQLGRGIDPGNPLYVQKVEGGATAPMSVAASLGLGTADKTPNSLHSASEAVERAAHEIDFELPPAPKTEILVMPPALMPPEPAPAAATATASMLPPLAAAAAASVAAAAASRASAVHERTPLDFKLDSGPDLPPPPASTGMDFVTLDGPITLTGATTLSGPSTLSGVTLGSPTADIWGERPLARLDESLAAHAPPVDKLPELTRADVTKPAVAAAVAAGTVSMAGFSPLTTSTLTRAPQPTGKLELDKLDLSFDPARNTFEDPTPSVLDGQWHDAATKLDLAKAYQEMGDVEGAREILQEVVQEGDDQQKKEAQSFLAKLRA